MKINSLMQCTIHNILYGSSDLPNGIFQYCPICQQKRIKELMEELEKVRTHRDILVQAFEIKQTSINLGSL